MRALKMILETRLHRLSSSGIFSKDSDVLFGQHTVTILTIAVQHMVPFKKEGFRFLFCWYFDQIEKGKHLFVMKAIVECTLTDLIFQNESSKFFHVEHMNELLVESQTDEMKIEIRNVTETCCLKGRRLMKRQLCATCLSCTVKSAQEHLSVGCASNGQQSLQLLCISGCASLFSKVRLSERITKRFRKSIFNKAEVLRSPQQCFVSAVTFDRLNWVTSVALNLNYFLAD